MTRGAYYNEIEPYAAQWLRNLIAANLIAPGDVDERSITDVKAADLTGYAQCHFFAGIGGWSVALRLAEWDDARPVWTGSCPCQPFSSAGKGEAADDPRHLWPAWFSLIAQCRPPVIFAEQVEAAIGWGWLDAVFADLEGEGYACGATVLPACGVGAPHIRQRLWFVAHAEGEPWGLSEWPQRRADIEPSGRSEIGVVADADGGDTSTEGLQRSGQHGQQPEDGGAGDVADTASRGCGEQRDAAQPWRGGHADRSILTGVVADRDGARWGTGRTSEARSGRDEARVQSAGLRDAGIMGHPGAPGLSLPERADLRGTGRREEGRAAEQPSRSFGGFWSDLEWIACTDGKARPTQPGLHPLAHGVQRRPSKLRAYGNSVTPQAAAEVIAAYMESRP